MAKVTITIEDLGQDRVRVVSTPTVERLLSIKKGDTLSPSQTQAIIAIHAILKNSNPLRAGSGIITEVRGGLN